MKRLFTFFLSFTLTLTFILSERVAAQTLSDSLLGVTLIGTDKLGNCYAVLESEIIKLDPSGKKLNNFSRKDFGPVSQIDSRDPLSIHLFYRNFGMVRILDNQMGETTTLDLRAAGLIDPVVIANAVDGGLWIYEAVNNQLFKFDERLQRQLLAINMFQFSKKALNPIAMKASDNWLALETENEIYLFDRFGSYARTIPLPAPSALLKLEDQQLWYSQGDTVVALNLRVNEETKVNMNFRSAIQQLELTSSSYWILTPEERINRIPRK